MKQGREEINCQDCGLKLDKVAREGLTGNFWVKFHDK